MLNWDKVYIDPLPSEMIHTLKFRHATTCLIRQDTDCIITCGGKLPSTGLSVIQNFQLKHIKSKLIKIAQRKEKV